jgi:hypothetical protein
MVTGTIVFGSWGLTSLLVAVTLRLFGWMDAAVFVASVSKGLLLTTGALLVLAMAAGLVLERSSVGRARPPKVERTQMLSARGPARLSRLFR